MNKQDLLVHRLAAYRVQKDVSQKELADAMGFKDRQTLSSIENRERNLKPSELLAALSFLELSFNDFIDSYSLIGEARFSWRQNDAAITELEEFEAKTSKRIALYRELDEKLNKEKQSIFKPTLPIDINSGFDFITQCAERLVDELDLGEIPSVRLREQLEKELNISTFYIDAPKSISGAAIKLKKLSFILINRDEVIGRQNFDLAHEAFHCLTWDAIPPEHIEKAYSISNKKPKAEKLADAFASALLMPEKSIKKHIDKNTKDIDENTINNIANRFGVSSQALKWRLVTLRIITRSKANQLNSDKLIHNGEDSLPVSSKLFNHKFAKYLHEAIDDGHLSVRKTASTLNMTIDEISALFQQYEMKAPFDL
jgi:Zn-dependent peptidase ImmA (M78 family)/DNA-binding XRE family transcriptional regulator